MQGLRRLCLQAPWAPARRLLSSKYIPDPSLSFNYAEKADVKVRSRPRCFDSPRDGRASPLAR
jgi:hypothetical protein